MFYFYERFKQLLSSDKDEPELFQRILSGASAGAIANTLTYPMDPIKAIMSSDFDGKLGGIGNVCKTIYMRSGLAGFYHGWTATM